MTEDSLDARPDLGHAAGDFSSCSCSPGLGVVASLAAWCFLEVINEVEDGVYSDLPDALGFDSRPVWWPLPVLAIAGLIVAFAIAKLPGRGGHVPAKGLNPSPTAPIELPGVIVAAAAGIGLGAVVGPEAPLIALGGGLGFLAIRLIRRDAPGAAIAGRRVWDVRRSLVPVRLTADRAVLLIEATGLGGPRRTLILIPGLLASGIGTLVSIGLGSWTGVDTADITLTYPQLPDFTRPDIVDFLWTVPLAAAIAVGTLVIFRVARVTERVASPRPFLALPLIADRRPRDRVRGDHGQGRRAGPVLGRTRTPWSTTPTHGPCRRLRC